MQHISVDSLRELYAKYEVDLRKVKNDQRSFLAERGKAMKPQLDDVEAEITYMRLRELRPAKVVEIGTFYGWSTMWQLSALRDNGAGHLYSFDIVDHVVRNVPKDLAERWTFTKGDVRENIGVIPDDTEYLFIDADHGARFARWYIENLFPAVPGGTPTSVHDVFHGRRPKPLSEGSVIIKWLAEKGIEFFTPSPAKAPEVFAEIAKIKKDLGLDEPVRDSRDNPMIFFDLPSL
ncbi:MULTISPECIES: class I SAM-dependent methyltransferase [unclassified Streptomyces]|uniref:class I SAM-dependent methyltransferase n=1 Tax=unclassified Streptomyces TaxID=2593676 RepID=UPI00369EC1D7